MIWADSPEVQQGQKCELKVRAGAGGVYMSGAGGYPGETGAERRVWWNRWEVTSKRNNTSEGLGARRGATYHIWTRPVTPLGS